MVYHLRVSRESLVTIDILSEGPFVLHSHQVLLSDPGLELLITLASVTWLTCVAPDEVDQEVVPIS